MNGESVGEDPEESAAALRWLSTHGIGQARLRMLREAFGGAAEALAAESAALSAVLRLSVEEAGRLRDQARRSCIDRARASIGACGGAMLLEGGAGYPQLLLASHDPPALLFARGTLDAEPEPAVAIVGSRRATAYGRLQAARLAVELGEQGITIVSGGARGIDAEAHRGALRAGGRTIAVLATGLDCPYPADHAPLFDAIVEAGGCVLTEQLPGVVARPELFPRRNRMIAALSLVTVVVEAASRSGALLTARIAVDDLSREAACMPGPVDSPVSEGCHRAVREGWAHLVTGARDVCELLREARGIAAGASELAGGADSRARRAGDGVRNAVARGGPGSGGVDDRMRAARAVDRGPVRPQGQPDCSADARVVLAAIEAIGGAGHDELELRLGWAIPRIACATLELEVAGLLGRRTDGAFAVGGRRC